MINNGNNNYAENSQIAISNAYELAEKLHKSTVSVEYMLYGLLSVDNCVAARLLKKYGVTEKKYLQSIKNRNVVTDRVSLSGLDFSPAFKSVINFAWQIAYSNNSHVLYTEHILRSVLENRMGITVQILVEDFNLPVEKLIADAEYAIVSGGKIREDGDIKGQEQKEDKKQAEKDINENLPESLRELGVDITERARRGKMDPIIGRDKETNRIIEILCRKTKNNPVLIGEAGVGKSAVVEGLAQAIVRNDVPEILQGKIIFSMEMGSLMAGTKYRGAMEEKLKNAIQDIISRKDIIVFIDEIHTLAQAGSHDNELSPADILKPYLARGEMQTIGATTTDEYRKFIEKDKALERRFQPIQVDEPSVEDTIKILKGLKDSYEAFHKVRITDDAIEEAVNLSVRYIMDRQLPDKAIDLIDEASSRARVQGSMVPTDIREVEKQLMQYTIKRDEAIRNDDWAFEQQCNEKIKELKSCVDIKSKAWNNARGNQTGIVDKEDIAKVVSSWTGVPVTKLTESEKDRLLKLEDILHKRVIGQHDAIVAVSRAIRRARAGLKDPKRPIGSFIFLGPTGVGKTELTKALAEALFDDENSVIRIDMSEYMESHAVSKLIGSPPGYVGFDDGGQLTEQVRRKPYSVVLFDEIEKAHPDVYNLMLQVLDEGRLTDSKGRTVSFKNCVIIMTSNVGVADLPKNTNKLGFNDGESEKINIKEKLMDALRARFKPEFINRVDVVVIFDNLTEKDIKKIAEIMIGNLNKKLKPQKIQVGFSDSALAGLVKEGYSPVYGARPLKRVIEQKVEDKLAECLLMGEVEPGQRLEVKYKNGEFSFKSLD